MKLEKFLQDTYGYNPEVKDNLSTFVEQWKSWYQGNVKSFHNYFIYNGKRKVKQQRYTMNMAKEISEEWADIIWSEKCRISFEDEKAQENANKLINANRSDKPLWYWPIGLSPTLNIAGSPLISCPLSCWFSFLFLPLYPIHLQS